MISVIIPVKNGTNYLAEAVERIKKQNVEHEIIVVDDGSTDKTAELGRSLGCKVVSIPNSGQDAAKNVGLGNSSGELVVFHDHDDVLYDGAFEAMFKAFDEDTHAVMAMAQDFVSPDTKCVVAPRSKPYFGFLSGAVMFRRAVFEKIGMFRADIQTGAVDIFLRMKEHGIEPKRIDRISVRRRIHDTNFGRVHRAKGRADYAVILRAKLAGN
jgi:glycosyltransferase involved in cell wall biosynthesis